MNVHSKAIKRLLSCARAAQLVFAMGLSPAGAADGDAPWLGWRTKLHADNPVIGLYAVSPGGSARTAPENLIGELAKADYVLLGEVHDNPDHHLLQAWIIDQLAANGRKPVVAFEMIEAGQEEALRSHLSGNATADGKGAEGLGEALDWEKRGWPAWSMYRPVAEAALRVSRASGGAAILSAGGPARDTVRSVSRQGLEASIANADLERMGLTKNLPEELAADLKEELFEDHCKLMPKEAMGPLVNVQRLRDAAFVDRMIQASDRSRAVVLIAGGGHVRKDRGAPYYLLSREPGAKLAVVIFAEANGEAKAPEQIGAMEPGGAAKADFVWVTPAAERQDQCEQLRKQFQKKKEHSDKPH